MESSGSPRTGDIDLRLHDATLLCRRRRARSGTSTASDGKAWAVEADPGTGAERRRIAIPPDAAQFITTDATGNPWIFARQPGCAHHQGRNGRGRDRLRGQALRPSGPCVWRNRLDRQLGLGADGPRQRWRLPDHRVAVRRAPPDARSPFRMASTPTVRSWPSARSGSPGKPRGPCIDTRWTRSPDSGSVSSTDPYCPVENRIIRSSSTWRRTDHGPAARRAGHGSVFGRTGSPEARRLPDRAAAAGGCDAWS